MVDGREIEIEGEGFWVGPALIDNVTTEMTVYTDEIFGPVLAVVRVATLDDAIDADQRATRTPTAPRSSLRPATRRASSSAASRWA